MNFTFNLFDWVLLEGCAGIIVSADVIGTYGVLINRGDIDEEYEATKFELYPVPLTNDILRLNGFKEIYGTGIFEKEGCGKIKVGSSDKIYEEYDHDLNASYITARYVHQIQQYYCLHYNDNHFADYFKVE